MFFFLTIPRPTTSTRTDPLFPYPTLFRSFSMGLAISLMPAFTDDLFLMDNDGSYHGIWAYLSQSMTCQLQTALHINAIVCFHLPKIVIFAHKDRKSTRLNSSH